MDLYTFSYNQQVTPEVIDELNHVNNVVYVQWIQDAAVMHWNKVAPEHIKNKYVWVIVRHEIDYKQPGKLNDELLIKTKVLNAKGVVSERQVQIFRASDLQLLVESKTKWCMIQSDIQRPARITDEIKSLFLPV
ncbi:MAG: acyl-CoA thioesterase [Bacteroidetes bacterium]|nr:MAG: acyl-CoA thioesterase [Bacteroidota bacterium]